MHTECCLIHEVDRVGSRRNIVVRKQDAAREFEIWRNAAMALEVPLQPQRIETNPVCGVCRLECKEYRNRIEREFETAAQKTGQVWVSKDPTIAQARVENSRVASATTDRVSASGPNLNLVSALVRRGLS